MDQIVDQLEPVTALPQLLPLVEVSGALIASQGEEVSQLAIVGLLRDHGNAGPAPPGLSLDGRQRVPVPGSEQTFAQTPANSCWDAGSGAGSAPSVWISPYR